MAERFILECINYEDGIMGRKTPNRTMYGLTMSFDMAHYVMEEYFKEKYEDVIIHPLKSIDESIELSIVEATGTLKMKGE